MNLLAEKAFEFSRTGIFSYSDVLVWLGEQRNSVRGLVKRAIGAGEIIHIRRGLYCLSPKYNRYVVCDEAPEAWWRGCKWRVAFWNRETERGVWIYSTRPALMPREKQSRLHPDPHPHFVMNGRYVVCTANNADGHMDLYVTPVDQLVKMTTP